MNKGAAFYCNYKIWLWTFGYFSIMIKMIGQHSFEWYPTYPEMTVNFILIRRPNMAKQNDDELDDIEMMSLELDDGTNLECEIVATFDVEDTSYIALLPVEAPEGYDDDEVLVYRYIELPNDEFTLEPIDDEEEFDMVADAFDEILDEMEFNSMSEDD